MKENLARISEMESILDYVTEIMNNPDISLEELEALQPKMRMLETYYVGQDWKDDLTLDEAGKIPKDLKRGVLSEDAIYNILERNRELMEEKSVSEIKRNDIEIVKDLSPEVYEFLTNEDKCNSSIPDGRIDITDKCYAMVSTYETAPRDNKAYESHRKYIDVQMLISGKEVIEISPIESLSVTEEYSEEKDCMFYSNEVNGDALILEPMQPVILMPDMGHMPGVAYGKTEKVKKVVVKIPVKMD